MTMPDLNGITPGLLEGAYVALSEQVNQITLAQELIRARQQGSEVDPQRHEALTKEGEQWVSFALSAAPAVAHRLKQEAEAARLEEEERQAKEQALLSQDLSAAQAVMAKLTPEERDAITKVMGRG